MLYRNITEFVGGTPLLDCQSFSKAFGCGRVLCKLEYLNPAGSVKDRAALKMIEDAEGKGILKEGSVIIEPTSGNTGIGIAAISAVKGYKTILVMPETMSIERRKLLAAYGAQIVLTEGKKGMVGAVEKANELKETIEGAVILGQFDNPANCKAHYETTGPELWEETNGEIAVFISGVGTGGTVSGVGKYLKEKNPSIRIVAVEPIDSPLLSEGKSGPHKLQGIGANFVPDILDRAVIDEVFTVSTEQAFSAARRLATSEGVLVGISSGAALYAASEISKRDEFKGKAVVALLPDTGDRYLSTELYTYE